MASPVMRPFRCGDCAERWSSHRYLLNIVTSV